MSYEELEQRVHALEAQVARLDEQVNGSTKPPPATESMKRTPTFTEDDIMDGVEIDIVLNVPPIAEYVIPVKLIAEEEGPKYLSLTEDEWKLYSDEDDHE